MIATNRIQFHNPVSKNRNLKSNGETTFGYGSCHEIVHMSCVFVQTTTSKSMCCRKYISIMKTFKRKLFSQKKNQTALTIEIPMPVALITSPLRPYWIQESFFGAHICFQIWFRINCNKTRPKFCFCMILQVQVVKM